MNPAASEAAERTVFSLQLVVPDGAAVTAPELLSAHCALSKIALKAAMQKGAVWRVPRGRRPERLRRASTRLTAGDELRLHYDSHILATTAPSPRCLADARRYSVWFKPAGLMVEGSRFGDHATLLRQVELAGDLHRRCWLVHRLDREASGLVLLAHTPDAAAQLSALFQTRTITKHYLIEVRGRLGAVGESGCWQGEIEGKPAETRWQVMDLGDNFSRVRIDMATGRHHQIRRHAEAAGHPVLGDPRYGAGNAHGEGLRLAAVSLAFIDPWRRQKVSYSCEDEILGQWGWSTTGAPSAQPNEA